MIEINKKNLDFRKIPAETGFYILKGEKEILHCGKTSNLNKSLKTLFTAGKEDKNIFQLISLCDKIAFQTTDSIFAALLEEKKILSKNTLKFKINQHENYVYLAIDFHQVPFLKITEHTTENYYYLGPFPDRFFLYDFIDIMAAQFQLPSCEDENFPCFKLKKGNCLGWCLKDKPEIAQMLLSNYLMVNTNLFTKLKNKLEKMKTNLEFEKAENLKKQINTIQKYYDFLRFFHVTKKLDLEFPNQEVKITHGMIEKIFENKRNYDFPVLEKEYRTNEFLAHDKSEFAERFIVYQEIYKNKLEQIEVILKASSSEMMKELEMEV